MSHVPGPPARVRAQGRPRAQGAAARPDRYALDLPLGTPPERLLADMTAAGAQLVSLNPLRETLEDFFVRQVAGAKTDRGLE
jgi:hypothetical protein